MQTMHMRRRRRPAPALFSWLSIPALVLSLGHAHGQTDTGARLAPPVFHHVHQNSADPAAAIAGFQQVFPAFARVSVAGFDGVQLPSGPPILFTTVASPPAGRPQSAFLRHVFAVADVRALVAHLRSIKMPVRPLYTLGGATVDVSSDSYQNGLTRAAYDDAKAKGTLVPPTRSGGYVIFHGPEQVMMEATERSTLKPDEAAYVLVDMWQDRPACAELWYRTHLNTPARGGRGGAPPPVYTEITCGIDKSEPSFPSIEPTGTRRQPGGGASFGAVSLNWFPAQASAPLAPTRGQLVDHFAVAVPALEPWITKLTAEGVTFLGPPYPFGDMRAVLIEGPSREAIEIIGK
jgi:hypothetical protein